MNVHCLLVLLFAVPVLTLAQGRRDSTFIDAIHVGSEDIRALEFGFGLFPPVRFGKNMILNSISGHQWEINGVTGLPQEQLRFSQYRYTPMLILPLENRSTVTLGYPMTFAAMEHEPRLRNDAYFNSIFMAYSTKSARDPDATWSFGLIVLDRGKRRQLFPTGSYSHSSADKKWRFAYGFPFVAVTYLPGEDVEVGTFLGRDTSQNFIPDEHPLAPQGRYLDQEQTVVGLATRFHLPHGFKLSVTAASMLSARYRFLDSSFNENTTFKEYRDLGYLKVGLSWSPARPKPEADAVKKD